MRRETLALKEKVLSKEYVDECLLASLPVASPE